MLKGRLIQRGLAIARELADRYESSEIGNDELFSEAVIAVCEEVQTFDGLTEEDFDEHLTQRIEERLQRCYSNLPWLLPIDYRVVQLHDRYREALWDLYPQSLNPDDNAIQDEQYVAEYLGVSLEALRDMKKEYAACRIDPLDTTVIDDTGEEEPLVEAIADPATDSGMADK